MINLRFEAVILKITLFLLFLFCFIPASADHKPDAEWSWHVVSAGGDESRMSIYRGDQLHGIYNVDCDLSNAREGERSDDYASINLVKPDSSPAGLLVISCNVGAHSQQIAIIDFSASARLPVFSATGSYSATWELQGGELWIGYDEPCDSGPTVDCPDGYATIFVPYQGPVTD
jgi:hypothetical protein